MDPQKITDLANLLRKNGDKILSSEFTLTLSGSLLRALNDSFTLIADSIELGSTQSFEVVKPNNSKSNVFRDLQLVHDFVQKTAKLCVIQYPGEDYFGGKIDIGKFRSLKRLEIQKTNIQQLIGIQPLRSQLQHLICTRSLRSVEEIITHCGGDNSNGFVWNELKVADFSYNNLQTVDSSLEFAQYLQHLQLRHNQLVSVEAIKWLPNLKTLDLSFNRLTIIPNFHVETSKRLQVLNLSNNFIEDLIGISKLDALTDLDLSDNCLLDHTYLSPLSALITLKYLNLFGNPLFCHPKHRLAVAQFLHKNTATVKFILDFEPLSKSEKALTGTHQRGHHSTGAMNSRYLSKANTKPSTSSFNRFSVTPSSSIGSLRSFKLSENESNNSINLADTNATAERTKRTTKVRTAIIEDNYQQPNDISTTMVDQSDKNASTNEAHAITKSLIEANNDHLMKKKQIESLREKYGAGWLLSQNAQTVNSVFGIESAIDNDKDKQAAADKQRLCHKMFDDFFEDFSTSANVVSDKLPSTIAASTPVDHISYFNKKAPEIVVSSTQSQQEGIYNNNSIILTDKSQDTLYKSVLSDDTTSKSQTLYESSESTNEPVDVTPHLKDVYSKTLDEEPESSDPEEDESTYIVYTANQNEALFLTLSSNFIREKDTLSQRTKTKWSLKMLESCDRVKSNTLRINFDTLKFDKRERLYTVEDGLCRELEKKLRDILSKRNLFEMNQTIYRCVNCTCQFSQENTVNYRNQEIRCPDCKSAFVAEIHELPKSLEKSVMTPPAIVMALKNDTSLEASEFNKSELEDNSINDSIGSANSLNESSSCSKISNPQSSFDSNQSVAGSSTTDRENDFKSNYESDVDILSNPSQSSIEILDQMHYSSRKTSEERRILQIPMLETINDSLVNNCDGVDEGTVGEAQQSFNQKEEVGGAEKKSALSHVHLTESSSSGSVTDSVCTAYDQAEKLLAQEQQHPHSPQKVSSEKLINEESLSVALNTSTSTNNDTNIITNNNNINNDKSSKKDETSITSMFGVLFQSTNLLMSRSQKLIDGESKRSPPSAKLCEKYKFNYNNFNDVDHRLKLYFYQMKFEEEGEHFKWIVRGKIYNENTSSLCDGIVVMSTMKFYIMEAFAPENEDVTKWLRHIVSVTVDRLESIKLLPWKIGLSFCLRDWGGFLLLLQDILRTDSLLLHFANNALPHQCDLSYETSNQILKRLTSAIDDEKLKMFSLINSCEIKSENIVRSYPLSGLFTTDTRLYLSTGNISWLSLQPTHSSTEAIDFSLTQFMSNLVEVERPADNVFAINFLDETQDKCELWKCTFETKQNAESCLNAIGQSWEQLFGVPLFSS